MSGNLENAIINIFGSGKDLNVLNMVCRSFVVAVICLLLLRFSGRRSFALGTPMDNVLAILLGAILSRAVTGASPFLPTIAAAATIATFHRVIAMITLYSTAFGKLVKGDPIIIFSDGKLYEKNMRRCRITMHDLMSGIRQSSLQSLDEVEKIYVERNGRFSVIKKQTP
jgi:uncharacterized membrane protein YcaP (DUF421 family)